MKAHSHHLHDPSGDLTRSVSTTSKLHGMDLRRPLVLVSGGPDSVALLRALAEVGPALRVLHFDHGLRGAESEADADFVLDLCEKLGVPCEVERLDLRGRSGMQEAARDARYRLAGEASERCGCTSIATGHNADDVAETMLINLARGAGTRGAAGIRPVSGGVVRPLIGSTRAAILAYLAEIGQDYRTDSSNLEGKYTRNRVRLEVIPALEEMYPGASRNLTRAAGLFREDLGTLEDLASRSVEFRQGEAAFKTASLVHPGLLGHAARIACSYIAPQMPPPASSAIREIEGLLEKPDGTRTLDLPGGVVVAVRFGSEVVFRRRGEDVSGGGEGDREVVLPGTGEIEFGGWTLRTGRVGGLDRTDAGRREVCYLDEGMGPYRVRKIRDGDKIRPLGLGGTKGVLRAMMDRKVPQDVREGIPVVVGVSGEVAWVFLGETGEKYAVKEGTEAVIRLEVSGGRGF